MTEEDTNIVDSDYLYKGWANTPNAPNQEDKHNTHTFLLRVATSDDTTKTGFITETELGAPSHSLRNVKDYALITDKIMGNDYFSSYFKQESENITATSLSREGFLVKQATTTTKQLADITKPKKENKGWFKKKEDNEDKLQT